MHHSFKLLSGLGSLLICIISYFALSSLDADYFHFTKAYSELGAVGKTNSIYFSVFAFLIPGILVVYFSLQLHKWFAFRKLPMILLAVSGLLIAIAAAPMDYANWTAINSVLHIVGSLASGVVFIIGALLLHGQLRNNVQWRPVSLWLLVILILMIASSFFRNSDAPGLAQKIGILSYYLYIATLSIWAFRLTKGNIEAGPNRH